MKKYIYFILPIVLVVLILNGCQVIECNTKENSLELTELNYNDIIKYSGELISDPRLTGRLKSQKAFKEFTYIWLAYKQYFYAEELNELMKDRINNIKTTAGGDFKEKGASLWAFAKDAVVNSAISIDFAGANVDMGDKQMTIAAKGVELNNIGNMTGSGKAVINLTGDGTLTLGGSEQ